jgi:alpha-beta hydrolase superfamily lysophospholipase
MTALSSPRLSRRSFLGLSGAAVAGGLAAAVSAASANAEENRATFVFISGSWHGAWCFQQVANEWIDAGFNVIARDLPGHGLNAQFPSSYLAGNLNPNEVSPWPRLRWMTT